MLGRFVSYLRPHTLTFLGAGLAMVARSLMLLAAPWPLKFAVDSVIFHHHLPHGVARLLPNPVEHQHQLLFVLTAATIAFGAGDAALSYLGNKWLLRAGQRSVFTLRCDLFAHMQRLSLAYHRRRRSGELLARLGGDIQTLQDYVVAFGTGMSAHVLTVVGMLALMFALDWQFAAITVSAIPVLATLAFVYTRRLRHAMRAARRNEGDLWGLAQEIVNGIAAVQAYGREEYEFGRFIDIGRRSLAAMLQVGELQAQFEPFVGLVMAIGLGATLFVGSLHVLDGTITAGVMLVFISYLRSITTPLRQLTKVAASSGKAAVALERISELFDEEPDICDRGNALVPSRSAGALTFRNVSFAYGDKATLHSIELNIAPGEHVAIVGSTGAGKSTLIGLVPRFHDPATGAVLLDGHDLRDLSLAFVRRSIALVGQEPILFAGTVWENIAYGRDGSNRDDAITAADAAGICDILAALVDGFDTNVGERGTTLSGGQRQCIAIARAMLRDAPIVILDEPTSSLDPLSEKRVTDALYRLTRGRTTLTIAHRLSTIAQADRVIVLEDGRIVEIGSHMALLANQSHYQRFWKKESQL